MEIKLDKNIRLQDDFNKCVNGEWLDSNQIPDDYTTWGTFTELMEENYQKIETLIEDLQPTNIEEQQIKMMWKSADSTPNIEQDFIDKIKYFYHQLEEVKTIPQLLKLTAQLNTYNIDSFFSFYSGPDSKQSNISIANIHSNGINLPDRDYYLDKENKEILSNYSKFITNMNSILMEKNIELGENITSIIIAIETELAQNKWSKVEARDRDNTYNKLTLLELNNLSKIINWKQYLKELGIDKLQPMENEKYYIIDNLRYITNLDNLFGRFSLSDIKIYVKWCIVLHFSSYLPYKLGDEYFDFYGRKLSGQQKPKPYWKRKISWCNNLIGEQIGKLYVKQYFPATSKDKVKEMVKTIIESFKEILSNVDWMGEETKKKALVKLSKFNVKMGYPDKWRDYSDLEIGESLIENLLNIGKNEWEYELNQMFQPVDKDKWEMHPQEINAYFYPEMNEIEFMEGWSMSTFGDTKNFEGTSFKPNHSYQIFGTNINSLLDNKTLNFPNYIKIDVDGIEHKILKGADNHLKNENLRSLSVELNENYKEQYSSVNSIMVENNFNIRQKKQGKITKSREFLKTYNFVFEKIKN